MIFLLLHARNGNGTNEAAAFEVNREAAAYTCELCRFQTGIGKRIAAGCHLQADQIRTLPEHVGCADLSAKSAEVDGADRLYRVIEQLLVAKGDRIDHVMAELFRALLDFRADLVCILIHELLEDQRLLLRVDNFHQLFSECPICTCNSHKLLN